MPDGPGYWLDPKSGNVHLIESTHNEWLRDAANRAKVGLTPKQGRIIDSLDPVREIDEIRMVGVLAGLVRVRDRHRNLTIQFSASPSSVRSVLRAIEKALPNLFDGREHFLVMQNLFNDSRATIWTQEFSRRLDNDQQVMVEREQPIPANEDLRRRMDLLLA